MFYGIKNKGRNFAHGIRYRLDAKGAHAMTRIFQPVHNIIEIMDEGV